MHIHSALFVYFIFAIYASNARWTTSRSRNNKYERKWKRASIALFTLLASVWYSFGISVALISLVKHIIVACSVLFMSCSDRVDKCVYWTTRWSTLCAFCASTFCNWTFGKRNTSIEQCKKPSRIFVFISRWIMRQNGKISYKSHGAATKSTIAQASNFIQQNASVFARHSCSSEICRVEKNAKCHGNL